MAFQWPCFANPVSVDTDRSWTAEFESCNQHNEECCYIVTMRSPSRLPGASWPKWINAPTLGYGRRLTARSSGLAFARR